MPTANAMKTNVGALRLKLNEPADSQLASALRAGACSVGKVGPRALATAIASHTVNALVEGEMLDPESATEKLRVYKNNLGQGLPSGCCILHFLLPEEGKLAMAASRLNSHAQLHVWEMAHRIAPPKSFYKGHPEILEACKLSGAVVLDAGTPSTLTLREKIPALRGYSNEEIVRRVEPADALGALGALRRIPVLHSLAGLVDPELLDAFDIDALRKEKTVPLYRSDERLTVAISNPYGNFKVLYEKRFPDLELSLVLTHAAQVNAILMQNQRRQQITQDEIRQLEVYDGEEEVKDFDLNAPANDSVVRNLQAIVQEGIRGARRIFTCSPRKIGFITPTGWRGT